MVTGNGGDIQVIEIITGILSASLTLFTRMAPYLLFGFTIAGVLHIFVDAGKISRYLGKSTMKNSIKASLLGIPLPLCSCSVIPTAMSLRKQGASTGSTLSFLISTPATGVDSIFATYSLLGWVFALYRVIASFVTGVLAGGVSNLFHLRSEAGPSSESPTSCRVCREEDPSHSDRHGLAEKIKSAVRYAFVELISENGKALLGGILAGGAITYFLPEGVMRQYMGHGIMPMLVMLVVSLPMYVCATSSVPIAAGLVYAGVAPGAAFVFLLAGPATNIVTISVVARNLGKKALAVYLGAITLSGIALGLALNAIFTFYELDAVGMVGPVHEMAPSWVGVLSAVVLGGLLARDILPVGPKKVRECH